MQQRGGGPGEGPGDHGDHGSEDPRPTGRRRRIPQDRPTPHERSTEDRDQEHHEQQDAHGEHRPAGRRSTAESRSRGGRVGVTYKYFGAPDGATAARVPISMRPEELGGDELGQGMYTKVKPETMAAMVLTGIEGIPPSKVPPLELVVLHPDYAVVRLPASVVEPLRTADEESLGAAAFIWSTVPDRRGPRDAFVIYQMLHEWQDFARRCEESGHQLYCLVWP
ncbi:hypothetical protein V2S66_08335 [Streptomyces sp. V4-01]|uniref:Uncharacterized protein n=1 Tax=Actinacidiphila polyblastidii TaxID=3110430 RepID=A0ABU7P855_9ACTN|nr:hypothetical protein [Streptomyces sp. V4-01]